MEVAGKVDKCRIDTAITNVCIYGILSLAGDGRWQPRVLLPELSAVIAVVSEETRSLAPAFHCPLVVETASRTGFITALWARGEGRGYAPIARMVSVLTRRGRAESKTHISDPHPFTNTALLLREKPVFAKN